MEILIVGILLVALMVYASTKIKKSAARAFEREVVETEHFRLVKPEGFISPVNEDSEYAFTARSKNFGENEAHETHQAKINLKIFSVENFDAVCRQIEDSADKILSENISTDDSREQKTCLLEIEKIKDDISFYAAHKIVESETQKKVYALEILVLQDFREHYEAQIDEVLNSFSVT
ncbi:MAG: hypothetical protein ACR2L1_02575 [Pyrinomonadaceae bacterium]